MKKVVDAPEKENVKFGGPKTSHIVAEPQVRRNSLIYLMEPQVKEIKTTNSSESYGFQLEEHSIFQVSGSSESNDWLTVDRE